MATTAWAAAALALWCGLPAEPPQTAPAQSSPPVFEVTVRAFDPVQGRVEIDRPASQPAAHPRHLLVADGIQPLGLLTWTDTPPRPAVFRARPPTTLPSQPHRLRAWCIRGDAVGVLLDRWPTDGALLARLDSIGPAAASAWVRAGRAQGVRPGDSWRLDSDGQPVARLDVRFVESDLCFCHVVPLVSDLRLSTGSRVALWPSPGRRSRGQGRSAVAFVELQGGDVVAWVAIPRNVACPPEPRIEFYRADRLIASGVAERRDDRFWYVRAPRMAGQDAVAVGDAAVIRTRADVAARRFAARVFEVTPEGYLINAGEVDGLAAGDTGTASRDGEALGQVVVRRVQRSYAVLRLTDASPDAGLMVGDQVRFAPEPEPARQVGTIERVTAERLFVARLTASGPAPLLTPLAVRTGRETTAVALLVATDGAQALGFAFAPSLTAPLVRGAELTIEAAEER
jgi:hypothetical protein